MEKPCLLARDVLSAFFAFSDGISCESGGGGQRENTCVEIEAASGGRKRGILLVGVMQG